MIGDGHCDEMTFAIQRYLRCSVNYLAPLLLKTTICSGQKASFEQKLSHQIIFLAIKLGAATHRDLVIWKDFPGPLN